MFGTYCTADCYDVISLLDVITAFSLVHSTFHILYYDTYLLLYFFLKSLFIFVDSRIGATRAKMLGGAVSPPVIK